MYVQSFVKRPPAFGAALVVVTLLQLYLASYRYRLWHTYGDAGFSAVDAPTIAAGQFQEGIPGTLQYLAEGGAGIQAQSAGSSQCRADFMAGGYSEPAVGV